MKLSLSSTQLDQDYATIENLKMIDFHAMSAKQAQSYMDSWLATTSEQREWLNKALSEDDRRPLQDDLDSLQEVGTWLESRAKLRDGVVLGGRMADLSDIDPAQVPSWFGPPADGWMFDNWTCWAIDAAALNYGYVVTKLGHSVQWVVAHERIRGYIDQNRPCLVWRDDPIPVPQNPVGVHVGALLRVYTGEEHAPESIRSAFEELGLH